MKVWKWNHTLVFSLASQISLICVQNGLLHSWQSLTTCECSSARQFTVKPVPVFCCRSVCSLSPSCPPSRPAALSEQPRPQSSRGSPLWTPYTPTPATDTRMMFRFTYKTPKPYFGPHQAHNRIMFYFVYIYILSPLGNAVSWTWRCWPGCPTQFSLGTFSPQVWWHLMEDNKLITTVHKLLFTNCNQSLLHSGGCSLKWNMFYELQGIVAAALCHMWYDI